MVYIIIANISLIVYFGIYALFLKNLTFFNWNRIYLLGALGMSFLLPLCQLVDLNPNKDIYKNIPVIDISLADPIYMEAVAIGPQPLMSFGNWLFILYGLGCVVFLIFLIVRLLKIRRVFRQGTHHANSFSFFHMLIVGDGVTMREKVIEHEYIHIKQGHSYDILFIELIRIFNWFNPVLYYYMKELKFQHECIADDICAANNKVQYAELLVANAMEVNVSTLFHEFSNQSFLKKRIMMLFKRKTRKGYYIMYSLVIPFLLIIASVALAVNPSLSRSFENTILYDIASPILKSEEMVGFKAQNENLSQLAINTAQDSSKDIVFIETEVLPEPNGGMIAFRKWIGENYVYSQNAINKGVSGRLEVSFIVEKDGTLTGFEVLKDLGNGTADELIRLLKLSKKWSPAIQNGRAVRFSYTLPLELHVTGAQKKGKEIEPVTIIGFATNEKERGAVNSTVEDDPQMSSDKTESVIYDPDVKPEPLGGLDQYRRWIGHNYVYPQKAVDAGVKGTILVSFIVEEDGSLSNFKLLKDLSYGTGQAALDVIKKSPKWKPATHNGKPVRVQYSLPITLNLSV